MYTYNLLIFGHELAKDPDISRLFQECEIIKESDFLNEDFKIGDTCFSLDWPYHGGVCGRDLQPCHFGICLTDTTDMNFVKFIRSVKEEDYREVYNRWLTWLKSEILSVCGEWPEEKEEWEAVTDRLFKFLDENEPCFYMIEVSS